MATFRLDSIEMPDGNEFEIPVFVAEYGVTTYAEIEAAYDAGKAVFCCKDGETCIMFGIDKADQFAAFMGFPDSSDIEHTVTYSVSPNGWNTSSNQLSAYAPLTETPTTSHYIAIAKYNSTITRGIQFGSSTTQYLANNGTWQNIPTVPTKVSDLTNDSGFITTETDPTVPAWAKQSTKPSYTASEVGAIAAPSSPATGSFLVWDGLAWVAQTLSTWQGGNY